MALIHACVEMSHGVDSNNHAFRPGLLMLSDASCEVLLEVQKQDLAMPLDPLRSDVQLEQVYPCLYCQCLYFLRL